MEYIEMVNQIVAAEHSARALADEAREKGARLEAGLDGDIAAMREQYMERARHRLEIVRQTEEAAADEAVEQLDRRRAETMAAVEASYARHRDQWADALFRMIAEDGS